jgi:DNA ligase (NAD+)
MNASNFLSKLKDLTQDDLKNIKGIGPILAENFVEFTKSDRFERLMTRFDELEGKGVELNIQEVPGGRKANLPLSGKSIVITGTFDISRDKVKVKLEKLGAKVSSQVSSNTTYLLAGDKAGSKLDKAEKLGIEIVRDLETLIGG